MARLFAAELTYDFMIVNLYVESLGRNLTGGSPGFRFFLYNPTIFSG